MSGTAGVSLTDLEKRYQGADRNAIERLSLEVQPGAFFSILGPSGCGKTTLLRILAGFEHPSAGTVRIGGDDVTAVAPRARDIAMVFQDYALYPHMNVRQNITFNLRNRRVKSSEIDRRLRETVEMLGIERHLDKHPGQLSGGERQRVALGRALIRQPRVFLMDEPLSNLDLKLREAMRLELGRLHQRLGITIIYVTHDQAEAMTLSTSVAIMNEGKLQQVGRPDVVYARPANTFVAKFIGSPSMNLFNAIVSDGLLHFAGGEGAISTGAIRGLEEGALVVAGVRPHELDFREPGEGTLPVRVNFTERMGRNNFVVCTPLPDTSSLTGSESIQVETPVDREYKAGTVVHLGIDPSAVKLFDAAGNFIPV